MRFSVAIQLVMMAAAAYAQQVCPAVNFLDARTVNLKPSPTTHLVVARQDDGSYTAFEVSDAAPYTVVRTTPHFETQLVAGPPHAFPSAPQPPAPILTGAASQGQAVAILPSGNYLIASAAGEMEFAVFDRQLNLVSDQHLPGAAFRTMTLADVNGDGALDLIAISFAQTGPSFYDGAYSLWTFLGNGDGTFQPGVSRALAQAFSYFPSPSVAVGDFNGDGKADLVIAILGVSVALGNGDGFPSIAALTS